MMDIYHSVPQVGTAWDKAKVRSMFKSNYQNFQHFFIILHGIKIIDTDYINRL